MAERGTGSKIMSFTAKRARRVQEKVSVQQHSSYLPFASFHSSKKLVSCELLVGAAAI